MSTLATNMFKKYTESLVREWEVGANVPAGTVVLGTESGDVGITLTASGGSAITQTTNLPGNVTSVTYADGGVGNKTNCAAVAVDGSWLLTVAGVSNGETVPDSAAGTAQGTKVYRVTADGTYSLSSSSAVLIGVIDDGTIVGGIAPVQIGNV